MIENQLPRKKLLPRRHFMHTYRMHIRQEKASRTLSSSKTLQALMASKRARSCELSNSLILLTCQYVL